MRRKRRGKAPTPKEYAIKTGGDPIYADPNTQDLINKCGESGARMKKKK